VTGFIDESIHTDVKLYVLGIVMADPTTAEDVRRALSRLVPSSRPPHWSKEDEPTRAALISAITALPIRTRVYGCRFESPKRQEAARARALTWLVQERDPETRQLLLGAREAGQDRHDRRVLGGLAGRPPRFGYDHAPYLKEPLLWVADTVVSNTAKLLSRGEDPLAGELSTVIETVGCEGLR
jgi:hypothetical protein